MNTPTLLQGAAVTAICALAILAAPARAVTFAVTYTDPAGYGFNDPGRYTRPPFSPSSPGTLGRARRAAFEAVMQNWGSRLNGSVPITVDAAFEAMGGTSSSAALAYAGPTYLISDSHANVPLAWRVAANAAQTLGHDFSPGENMIVARFNSDVDGSYVLGSMGFYYGVDGAGGGDVDFYSTTIHEFGHGLGFISLVEEGMDAQGYTVPTGEYLLIGGKRAPGYFDAYMVEATLGSPAALTSMTVAKRKAALLGDSLYFNGPQAIARNGGLRPKLFAPAIWEEGSSVSHLDEYAYRGSSNAPSINEMMTPYAGPGSAHAPGPATTGIFQDLGYVFKPHTMAEAAQALRAAGGLTNLAPNGLDRLNVANYNVFPGRVDLRDALKIARMAAGAEANPNP